LSAAHSEVSLAGVEVRLAFIANSMIKQGYLVVSGGYLGTNATPSGPVTALWGFSSHFHLRCCIPSLLIERTHRSWIPRAPKWSNCGGCKANARFLLEHFRGGSYRPTCRAYTFLIIIKLRKECDALRIGTGGTRPFSTLGWLRVLRHGSRLIYYVIILANVAQDPLPLDVLLLPTLNVVIRGFLLKTPQECLIL
jgi:hypothetical protein